MHFISDPGRQWDSEGEAMSGVFPGGEQAGQTDVPGDGLRWYAVHTRARHEKLVVERLRERGMTAFLPLTKETHRWSDRKKTVEMPLFSCYTFVRMAASVEARVQVCQTNGVLQIVGPRGEATPIPDEQIESIRSLLNGDLPWTEHPFLKIGQRVRIRGGAMDGVEGILLARGGDRTLVVSVDVIQRSLAVRIEGYNVDPL
jgi:transcription antitermination factor NusG